MTLREAFSGFFSYSHHDARTDPKLIEAFTIALEDRTAAKLTNASFKIWRDTHNLRIGERWDDQIGQAIKKSSIFVVLLSPKWIESDYCRKEYTFFVAEVESKCVVGEYVAPLLIRKLDDQRRHFNLDQKRTFTSIHDRQHAKMLSADFLRLSEDDRTLLVEQIADDIAGMIERLRGEPPSPLDATDGISSERIKGPRAEFDARAHNFRDVDIVSTAEVLVEPKIGNKPRAILVHVEFLHRMYVQSSSGRVEFGVRRATLSLDNTGSDSLYRNDEWTTSSDRQRNAYYINTRDTPRAITVCIDPLEGNPTLQELPLPPAAGENCLSKVAVAPPHTDVKLISATLSIDLGYEGLFIFAKANSDKASIATMRKIATIISIAAQKEASAQSGVIKREIPVRERHK